jgi:hypothetical protein
MQCQNCGTNNQDKFQFCIKCGQPLRVAAPTAPPPRGTGPLAPRPPSAAAPSYAPPAPEAHYGESGISVLNIWGPFAGKGTRRRHTGWLMEDQGHRAKELVAHIHQRFQSQDIPRARIDYEILVAQGIGVENRPYFLLRRGLVYIGLYVAEFGRNLFISQVSYLKPPISNFRVIVVVAMIIFQLFMTFMYTPMLSSAFQGLTSSFSLFGGSRGSESAMGMLLMLFCVIGPLGALNGLLVFILFLFSLYKWLTEKDFFAALRVLPNEFNEDDLMAMEKAVEQTVRNSLTAIKLNPEDLQRTEIGRGAQLF